MAGKGSPDVQCTSGRRSEEGDRVSTFLYNTELLATVYFACGKIGAIINPINFRLNSDELAFIMHDAEPKVFLFEEALQNVVEGIAPDFGQIVFWYEGGIRLPFQSA